MNTMQTQATMIHVSIYWLTHKIQYNNQPALVMGSKCKMILPNIHINLWLFPNTKCGQINANWQLAWTSLADRLLINLNSTVDINQQKKNMQNELKAGGQEMHGQCCNIANSLFSYLSNTLLSATNILASLLYLLFTEMKQPQDILLG